MAAQIQLGYGFRDGKFGRKDATQAFTWFSRAAKTDNPEGFGLDGSTQLGLSIVRRECLSTGLHENPVGRKLPGASLRSRVGLGRRAVASTHTGRVHAERHRASR